MVKERCERSGIGRYQVESEADDAYTNIASDTECDDVATMSHGGRWVINGELSCDLRSQPLKYLA